ncbi:MAG: glycosyltransferase [Flammeovirgaceae bacterium]|nr:glycosyltransferase [Flammeovirgaceae bacterium]
MLILRQNLRYIKNYNVLATVTIICIVFNQEKTLEACIQSVRAQTYQPIELLVIDDASTDHSQKTLLDLQEKYKLKLILHTTNKGYCQTFNEGLAFATGQYVLDLSADDLLHPEFIAISVNRLRQTNNEFAAHYCDAWLLDEQTQQAQLHSLTTRFTKRPEGNIYTQLIQHYFICSPTVLFKRDHLLSIKGYDETLLYEDFDIQIRLARRYKFCYSQEPLLRKTVRQAGMSKKFSKWQSPYQRSTYKVCQKIYQLNKTTEEHRALATRCVYESKQNFLIGNWKLTVSYIALAFKALLTR